MGEDRASYIIPGNIRSQPRDTQSEELSPRKDPEPFQSSQRVGRTGEGEQGFEPALEIKLPQPELSGLSESLWEADSPSLLSHMG